MRHLTYSGNIFFIPEIVLFFGIKLESYNLPKVRTGLRSEDREHPFSR